MSMQLLRYEDLPIINGEKVRLRPITEADTADIVRWRNDPEVQQYFIFRQVFTPEIHQAWLENKVFPGHVIQYIIEEMSTGKSVGSVYFRDVDPDNDSAEYGIFIGESSARGRGFGSETAMLFTDFGLYTLNMHRISLRLLDGNLAARRSYEKAGFVVEGIFRDMVKLDGKFTDVIFMAKLKKED